MSGFLTSQRLDSLGAIKDPPHLSSMVGHSSHIANTLRHSLELPTSLLQASPRLSLQVLIHSYSYLKALPQKYLEEKGFSWLFKLKFLFEKFSSFCEVYPILDLHSMVFKPFNLHIYP
jgi:hypothetical protein